MTDTATLLVACPDRKGLVAALASLLSDHGANILEAQQHLDPVERIFSQRIHFDLADLDLPRADLENLLRIECGRYQMRWRISYGDRRKRVAIFVSRFEHCLYDLLIRHRLTGLAWQPLVEWTRRRHLHFRRRLAARPEPAPHPAPCVVSAGV